MAEIIEGEVITGGQMPPAPEVADNGGKTAVVKKTDVQPTDGDNRVKLYNEILNLKEQGFSDVYKKIGYKKFDSLLQNDREFQSALLTDLNERGYEISPEDFAFAYTKQSPSMVADFDALPKQAEPPLPQKDEDGLLSQVKGMFKSVYNYTKEPIEDLYKFAKRGFYTGLGGRGAQAENFATGTVDTKNLAEYLKKANDVGTTRIEAEFAKDEGLLKDTDDLLAMLIPSVVESFANMAGAGYKKLLGITAAGAGTGAAIGGLPGAAIGGGRALQGAMLQQGYNLEFVGTVIDELSTKKLINLDSDVNTIEKQLNSAFANKELMKPIFEKANTRAADITATDFVLSGMGATVARKLAKSKVAGKVMNTKVGQMFSELAEKTVSNPVYRKAARLTNRVAEIDKKIAGSKLGKAGVTVGVQDMFGGAAGETIAQALTQDELDWKSIAVEAGAEGKFINTLRALGKIGEKRISQKAISQFATEKNLPPNQKPPAPEDEFVAVTEEELKNYKKGNVSPERAAGLADDVDIAFKNPTHIEKVKAADSLYGEMLQDAFNKHMAALENQKLRDVALTSTAETYGKTAEEIATIIDPNNPAYNEKIANEVKNAYEVLKQQYKEQTGDDSEDTTGLSGEVGGGAESQQTKSQQGASEEEAGDGGVVQAAADEVRLSDIDEMLADDDNFFKDTGDRLLSPEERQDLEQERVRLTTAAGTTTQQTGVGNAPTQEGTQQTGGVSPQPASTEVVGNTGVAAAPQGETTQQPAATTEAAVGETVPAAKVVATESGTTKRGKKAAGAAATATTTETKTEEKPAPKEIKSSDVEIRKGKTHDKDGVYEAVYKGKVIGKMSFDKKEKVWVDASGDKFAQKKDAISKFVLRYNMANEAAAETTTTKGEGKGKAAPTGKAEAAPTGKAEPAPTSKTETKTEKGKTETKGETKPTGKKETKPQTPKTNPFAETVRKGMEALMGAIGSKVKMNFLSPEEAAKIAAMPEKKRGKLLFQTTAWHGTPHTFPKFRTNKINTGEQAQAFGWGLYFTDDKEIAEYYANELAGLKDNISLEELKNILPPSPNFESLANNLQRNVRVRGINEGVQKFKEQVELLGEDSYTPEELEFVKNLKQEDVQTKNVYKVTLFKGKKRYVTAPIKSSDGKWNVYDSVVWDKIQAMPSNERQGILDNFDKVKPQKRFNSKEEASNWIADNNEYTWLVWDKPVGANAIAKINKALEEKGIPATPKKYFKAGVDGRVANGMTGEEVYRELSKILGDNVKIGGSKEASLFLLENGIDGVKYPAKSVGTGITSDTARDFNYVVFDENAITVEERNGEIIPVEEFVETEGVQYMKTPDGKILGFVQKLPDGSYNVYINPETQDAETPVHEIAGHIFLPLIKESNPELYNQGTALIKNSEYMGKANGDVAEALALAVGDKGKLLAERPRKGFMEWLKGMWEWVGDKLRLNPDKIKNLTLGQFTDLIAGSVLKGKELAGTKPTETAEAKPTPTAAPAKAPSFSEFDAISADRGKMKEAKAEFIAKHGQLAYDAMKEISANFTKITKALQEKEILTKKC